ncbi:hypothetical protein [Kitasatospora sp. NPDC001132]
MEPDGDEYRFDDLDHADRLAGEEIGPRGPVETEAARRLADDLNNQ